jgi:hypothetical protein
MALTEKVRRRLEGKAFGNLFTDHEQVWIGHCNKAYALIKPLIPSGEPTVDDIKLIVQPLIELDERYTKFMGANPKLTQKYWTNDFTDYVLHRVYNPKLTMPQSSQSTPPGAES